MESLDISEHKRLWDGSEPGWVVLRISTERGPRLVPYNSQTFALLKLEDDVAHHVALRMKFAGAPVWDRSRESE